MRLFPRQHGGWAMLLAAFIIGTAAGGVLNVPGALFLVCCIGGLWTHHLAREPLVFDSSRGRWLFTASVLAAILPGGIILFGFGRSLFWLPVVSIAGAAAAAHMVERRFRRRTMVVSLLNVLALSGILPAAAVAASGRITMLTAGLWALCLLFFFSSIARVRFRTRRCSASALIAFHLAALGAAGLLWGLGIVPALAAGALLPAAAVALILAWRAPTRTAAIRRIGVAELAQTAVFVALCVAAGRGG